MEIPCGNCRTPAPRTDLHRSGNRLLCTSCLSALAEAVPNREGSRGILSHPFASATAGVLLRTLLFLPLFLWAHESETGAAALQGAVGGDLFGWAALTLLLRPFRKTQAGVGAVVELILVGLYLQRETLFEITNDIETTAISALFFFGVLFAKTGLRVADFVLEITGVKENA